ncbi:MAG: hypothetical protein C3F11_08665 [Methylocystaceae bacterium]|nr:MAG: hypothetical protein C3F11_08665 [Methylocystaceae bacterium]
MLWFASDICHSGFLPQFASDYSFSSDKECVIAEGEIGLSKALMAEGFRIKALFDYETVSSAWIRGYETTTQLVRDLPGLPFDNAASYKKALLERLDFVVSHVLAGNPMNPSHFFWDTLVEEFGFPFIKRELITVNPCDVPTYFKLAAHLLTQSEIETAVMEIRRHYGGRLVPTAILQRQPMPYNNKLLLAKDYRLEPLEPTLRSFRPPEINGVARIDKSA